jgi:bacterioferritin-associated ferredoxin
MIICSCNVLSEAQLVAAMQTESPAPPRSPAEAYRCLSCAPRCGRCAKTIRALIKAHVDSLGTATGCSDPQ